MAMTSISGFSGKSPVSSAPPVDLTGAVSENTTNDENKKLAAAQPPILSLAKGGSSTPPNCGSSFDSNNAFR